jgi:hypothetical protein
MASYLDIKNTILERINEASNPNEKKELYVKLYRLNEAYSLFDQALESFGKEVEPDNWEDAQANKGSDMSGNGSEGKGVDNSYATNSPISGEGGNNQNFDEEDIEDFAIYIPDDIKKQAQVGFTYKNPQGVSYQKQRNGRWKKIADEAIAQKKPGKLKKGAKTEKLGENEFVKVEKPTKALLTKLEKRGKDKPFRSWNTTSGYLFYYDPKTDSWYKSTNTFSQKADALKAFESIQTPKKEEGYQPPVPIGTPLGSQEPEEQTPPKEEETPAPQPKEETQTAPKEEKAPPVEEETPAPEPEKKPKAKAKAPSGNKPVVLTKHDVNFISPYLMKLNDAPQDVQDWFNTHESIGSNLFVDKDGTFWMYEHGTLRRSDVPLDEKKIKAYHRLQETAAEFAKSDRYQQFIDGYLSESIDKTMSLMTDEEAIAINYLSGGDDSFRYGLKAQGRRIGKNYTGAGYTYINSFLRKRLDKFYVPTGDKKSFNKFLIRQAAKVRVFNQYLDSQEKDTSKLIRGKSLNADSFEMAKDMFKVGEVIYDPGYSSASRKKNIAKGFASKKTHQLYIEFDSDHGGVDIKKISQYGTEDETLIPQSAKFEIYDVVTTDTKMMVRVRRVKDEQQQEGTKIPFSEEM